MQQESYAVSQPSSFVVGCWKTSLVWFAMSLMFIIVIIRLENVFFFL